MTGKIGVCLLIMTSCTCFAQKDPSVAEIKNQLRKDSLQLFGPRKVSFDFQFDNRHSFIQNKAITIDGLNPGIVINQKYRFGLGLYRVINPYETFKSTKKSSVTPTNAVTNRELDLYFATPNFRYIFYKRKWIQSGVEAAIGFGEVDFTIKNEDNTKTLSSKKGLFIPAGVGLELVLIPIRWAGLHGSFGYRESLKTEDINADFDGLYFAYGVKVFLGTIYKDLKYHAKKRKSLEAIKKIEEL